MIIVIKNAPATWNQEMQHLREVIIVQSCSWIVVRLYEDNEDNEDKDVNTNKPIHNKVPHDDDGNEDDYKPIQNKVPHTTPTALPKLTTKDETS